MKTQIKVAEIYTCKLMHTCLHWWNINKRVLRFVNGDTRCVLSNAHDQTHALCHFLFSISRRRLMPSPALKPSNFRITMLSLIFNYQSYTLSLTHKGVRSTNICNRTAVDAERIAFMCDYKVHILPQGKKRYLTVHVYNTFVWKNYWGPLSCHRTKCA